MLRPRSLCLDVLMVLGFIFSLVAIIHIDVVGSFTIYILRVLMKMPIQFLVALAYARLCLHALAHDYGLFDIVDSMQVCNNYVWNVFKVDLCR